MRALTSLLYFLFGLVFTPPFAIVCLILFPFMGAQTRYRFVSTWNHIMLWLDKALCGISYEIQGQANLDAHLNDPVVLLSKHQSAWETIAYIALMPKPLCYVFKRELLMIPFFGWVLGSMKMVYIDRKDGRNAFASVSKQGAERLADGSWIIMFPEGTRIPSGQAGKYKAGGARLAIDTQAWVIPIAHNAGRVWPKNKFIKTPGHVIISAGPAISSLGKTADALNTEVEAWIETEMRRIDPESYR